MPPLLFERPLSHGPLTTQRTTDDQQMSKLPTTQAPQDAFLQSHIAFDDPKHHLRLYHGDCLEILEHIPDESFDLVFADPPYFLSNGGITCHAGDGCGLYLEPAIDNGFCPQRRLGQIQGPRRQS